ncbi:MAG: hypothetical protein ACSHXI_06955 [Hoeflea sp.]|uniref:hypothetical protein n=1 Tax=Hoeflea sp. TaxID=1940281 RepID=UPI003EF9B4D0
MKITKSNADNPYSTPDADRHKFHYNSKDHNVAEVATIKTDGFVDTNGAYVYTGGGGTSTDYMKATRGDWFSGSNFYFSTYYHRDNFPTLDYHCPLVDFKYKDGNGKSVDLKYYGVAFTGGGYDMISPRVGWSLTAGDLHFVTTTGYASGHAGGAFNDPDTMLGFTLDAARDTDMSANPDSIAAVIWNLPGDNTPVLQDAPATPVDGHKTVLINPTEFKIAKPGYDIASATKAQLAFSAVKNPVKVIASGDIAIAASATTSHDFGFTVDASVYVDVQYYETGGDIYYPASPSAQLYGAKYYVSGSAIYFENAGAACRARFIVMAVDTLGASTGSNKPLQQFEEGGEKVVRILAPGSGSPARLSDIVVDSRWPTLPILAEGYVSVSVGVGGQPVNHVIDFTNPGLLPFVKMSVIRSFGGKLLAMPPLVRRLRRSGAAIGDMGGDTVYTTTSLSGTRVTITTHRGNVINAWLDGALVRTESTDAEVVGVRYYVFGIPA